MFPTNVSPTSAAPVIVSVELVRVSAGTEVVLELLNVVDAKPVFRPDTLTDRADPTSYTVTW
jgi:hypothetical protein